MGGSHQQSLHKKYCIKSINCISKIRINCICAIAEMYKEAEATMMEAIGIMPDQPQFYYTLGVMLGRLQRLEVSIQQIIIIVACCIRIQWVA